MEKKLWIVNKVNNTTANILLYGYIYDACASDFVKQVGDLEKEYSVINIRINSGGGDVFDGFAIYNALKQSKAEINTYVDGIAGSMASIVSQAGKKRYVSKVGRIMTHKPSAWGGGNSETLRENADMLESIEAMMCSILSTTTGQSKDECKNKFLNGKDNWFDADQAVAEKLADEIYDAEPLQLPAAAKTEEDTWKGFNDLRFAAVFNQSQNQNSNMDFKLSAASKVALGIGDNADNTAIDAAISTLKAKADKADAAEKKYNDHIAAENKTKVTALLTAAKTAGKINDATLAKLETDYAGKPDDLKVILDGMTTYKPITAQLKEGGQEETDEQLVAEYEKLDKMKGAMAKLKKSNFERFKLLHQAKFGREYTGKE